MSKHKDKKKKKQKIRIYFKDGKSNIIPQKFWDDYEVNYGLFVVKKNERWIAFYSLDMIACTVIW